MWFNPKIHSLPLLLKSVFGNIESLFFDITYSSSELIVVNYHSTPKKFSANFERQVKYFKRHFNIISPLELENFFYSEKFETDKCSLLFTFDDGLKNNLNAVNILEKYQVSAMFFVVPEFIDTPANKQKKYYLQNIRPVINYNIDNEDEDFTALSWEELRQLISKGHKIGAHTLTHTLIASKSDIKNSTNEILDCKKIIEKETNSEVNSFCSINNTSVSIGKTEKELIKEGYKFHFTTFPGLNQINKNPLLIKRRNIESFWLQGAVLYAIGKLDLKRWEGKIKLFSDL